MSWVPKAKPPRRIKDMGYISLDVSDLERSKDFYTRVVNMVLTEEDENTVYLRAQQEHHAVVLHRASEARVRHMGFETLDDADTEALRAHLESHDVPTRDVEDEQPGRLGLAFQFQDPDGHWYEVYRAQPRRAPLPSPSVFPLLKLGHFTLRTKDVQKITQFHREIVGLRISDYAEHRGVFMRFNQDHHGLAFQERGKNLFHHMAFDVGDWNGTKAALDWLARAEWAVEDGPVKHGPGNNIAVYFGDPDGFHVELYSEMEQIHDDEDHFRTDYLPFRNLWTRGGSPEGYHDMIPRDEHGKFLLDKKE